MIEVEKLTGFCKSTLQIKKESQEQAEATCFMNILKEKIYHGHGRSCKLTEGNLEGKILGSEITLEELDSVPVKTAMKNSKTAEEVVEFQVVYSQAGVNTEEILDLPTSSEIDPDTGGVVYNGEGRNRCVANEAQVKVLLADTEGRSIHHMVDSMTELVSVKNEDKGRITDRAGVEVDTELKSGEAVEGAVDSQVVYFQVGIDTGRISDLLASSDRETDADSVVCNTTGGSRYSTKGTQVRVLLADTEDRSVYQQADFMAEQVSVKNYGEAMVPHTFFQSKGLIKVTEHDLPMDNRNIADVTQNNETPHSGTQKSEFFGLHTDRISQGPLEKLFMAKKEQEDISYSIGFEQHHEQGQIFYPSLVLGNGKIFYMVDLSKLLQKKNAKAGKQLMNEIVEKAMLLIDKHRSELEIQIRPEHLGRLVLRVATEDGILTARITTQTQEVKELLQAHAQELKDSLKEHGYNLSRLDIDIAGEQGQLAQRFYHRHNASTFFSQSAKIVNEFNESQENPVLSSRIGVISSHGIDCFV